MNSSQNKNDPHRKRDEEHGLHPVHQGYQGASSSYNGSFDGSPSSDGLDIFKVARILLRRWLTVLLMVVCGGLSGLVYFKNATPVYQARADMEMRVRRPRVINNDALFEDNGNARDTDSVFNTRFEKFKSPAMERLATEEYFKLYPAEKTPGIVKYTLPNHIREVHWSKDPKADIVRVVFLHSDAGFAARLVNVLTDCAGILMMQENRAMSDEAVKWLISQVNEQRDSLEEVEMKLVVIREELQLDYLEQRKQALSKALISVSEERELLISALASRQTVYTYILSIKGIEDNLEVLPSGLPREQELNELIRSWRDAHDELMQVSSRYTEIHPVYRSATEKEQRTLKRLEQFIELTSQSVENEIELMGKQVEQINDRIEKMKTEALTLEKKLVVGTQRLQRLERERDAADTAYQSVLRRMEEARLSADENMAYTKIIRRARDSGSPVSPQLPRSLAVSVILGGLLGCLVALLMEFASDRVSSVKELKDLGLTILCTIPTQKRIESRGELASVGLRNKFSLVVEIFAEMNALISSQRFVDRSRVVLLTSVLPGEGKTIAACNLAISAALNGSRTLLIDGDMRRPQIYKIFGIDEAHPSLLEWLSSKNNSLSYEELISHDVVENLDVITTLPLSEINPAELLGRERLTELLEWARENYDRVIIDSPPLGPVGDAQVLANNSDSVILVSRIGKSRRRGLRFALTRFGQTGVPVLGCIANNIPHSLSGMFGGGDSYGYSSGYTSD